MTILLILSYENLRTFKGAIRQQLPRIGSSHISEAIARALDFKTHIGALAHIRGLATPEVRAFRHEPFVVRLAELGYAQWTNEISPDLVLTLGLPVFPAYLDGDRVIWSELDAVLVRLDEASSVSLGDAHPPYGT